MTKLTPEVAEQIVAFIRSGSFPLAAAEAAGVPAEVFRAWLARGQKKRAGPSYRRFAQEVGRAAALCRVLAELNVCKKDPKFWLTHGPGRDRPGQPGWAGEVRAGADDSGGDLLDWRAVCLKLLQALADFPEARVAAAQALQDPNLKCFP